MLRRNLMAAHTSDGKVLIAPLEGQQNSRLVPALAFEKRPNGSIDVGGYGNIAAGEGRSIAVEITWMATTAQRKSVYVRTRTSGKQADRDA